MQYSAIYAGVVVVFGSIIGAGCGGDSGGGHNPPTKVNNGGAGASGDGTGGTGGGAGASGSGGTNGGGGSGGASGTSGGTGGMGTTVTGFGDDPERNAVVAGTICDRLSTIQCAGEAACCDAPGRDVATCKTTMFDLCTSTLFFDKIAEQKKSGFDPVHAKDVFTMVESMAMSCDPGLAAFGESVTGLRSIFQGTLPENASCTPIGGLTKSMAAAALASCVNPDTHACLPDALGITWGCKSHAGEGKSCFTDINCTEGLYCPNPDLIPASGAKCTPRKAAGEACGAPNECASLFCRGGMCVAADKQSAYCLKE
jgi:hypothetical protein